MDEIIQNENTGIRTAADLGSVETAADYVREVMESNGVSMKLTNKMSIAFDEFYSNIVHYSGATWAAVRCTVEDGAVTVELTDNGAPFDPTRSEDPDVSAPLEERGIGGLGIFMAKKLMNEIVYSYQDGTNRLRLVIR